MVPQGFICQVGSISPTRSCLFMQFVEFLERFSFLSLDSVIDVNCNIRYNTSYIKKIKVGDKYVRSIRFNY